MAQDQSRRKHDGGFHQGLVKVAMGESKKSL
jgi:hypothetical protein